MRADFIDNMALPTFFQSLRSSKTVYLPLAATLLGVIALLVLIQAVSGQSVKPVGVDLKPSAVGLDAAEKGSTAASSRRNLAGHVPYDLEKRAILHKVRQRSACSLRLSGC